MYIDVRGERLSSCLHQKAVYVCQRSTHGGVSTRAKARWGGGGFLARLISEQASWPQSQVP